MFTKKFDSGVWRWLVANVLGKLCPAATAADAGKVVKVDSTGAYVLGVDTSGLPLSGGTMDENASIEIPGASGEINLVDEVEDTFTTITNEGVEVRETGAGYTEITSSYMQVQAVGNQRTKVLPDKIELTGSNSAYMTLDPATGISMDSYHAPQADADFVQKKYVDDRVDRGTADVMVLQTTRSGKTWTPNSTIMNIYKALFSGCYLMRITYGVVEHTSDGSNAAFDLEKVILMTFNSTTTATLKDTTGNDLLTVTAVTAGANLSELSFAYLGSESGKDISMCIEPIKLNGKRSIN